MKNKTQRNHIFIFKFEIHITMPNSRGIQTHFDNFAHSSPTASQNCFHLKIDQFLFHNVDMKKSLDTGI